MVDRLSELSGVYVEGIDIRTEDMTGIDRGASTDLDFFPADMVDQQKIREKIDSLKDLFDFRVGDKFSIQYRLLVRSRTKTSAKAKARGYVRVVNPFSTSKVEVVSATMATDKDWLTDVGPLSEFYNIKVKVGK